ncbi:MAG: hypothetical protein Tp152SUR359831_11 [Prokaryotic dsDNA virus sp.]|nr:MAG: hypothetical protein Unbinned4026contig1003_37 [Prokaryotic dsDNA virus sp.]QDP52263.1 MAG: hypothetical protein Tp152SUR359831_11 [Prokaryotic dsDNA virus sp.]|tara:strand:- start:5358 stop:5552 length:195 start_codon:yes stop_codon:yes gene_type:complete
MNELLKNFLIGKILKSKKAWYTIAGIIVQLLHESFGLDPQETQAILYSIIALVIGQGLSDSAKK